MEDQVPFKVYAFLPGQAKPEVRRFGVEKSVVSSYHYLNAKLQDVYPSLKNMAYKVSWRDEDGDDVTISSDDEVMIALGQMREDVVKLYVHCKEEAAGEPDTTEVPIFMAFSEAGANAGPPPQLPHFGVVCDACDSTVVGFRYKCATCPDYDLCARCEAAREHGHHCMIRLPMPQLPHEVLKATVKRARQFMKSVAVKEECPFKKHRRDRSADQKHHHEDGHHKHGRHARRQRGSWLDTFATYMNEFANLAGDVDCPPPKTDPPTSQASQTNGENGDGTQAGPTPPQPGPSAANVTPQSGPTVNVAPINLENILKPENVKYLLDIQKTLTDILVPNLAPEKNDEMGGGDGRTAEMNKEGGRNSMESDKGSVASTGSNDSKFVDVNDKAEGWTVINNDLVDVAAPSAPAAPAPGFNLPQQFEQHVTISAAQPRPQSIYPPLNAATAVLDPQTPAYLPQAAAQPQPQASQPQPQPQASQPQPQPQASQPQPQPQASRPQPQPQASRPQPQPQRRHLKAHIAAAIENMLVMGFNNDGEWLTQLLEKYDGNISSVLDLLSPVAPKKK